MLAQHFEPSGATQAHALLKHVEPRWDQAGMLFGASSPVLLEGRSTLGSWAPVLTPGMRKTDEKLAGMSFELLLTVLPSPCVLRRPPGGFVVLWACGGSAIRATSAETRIRGDLRALLSHQGRPNWKTA